MRVFDTGVASLANQATNWLNVGHLPQRMGSQHPNIAPYGDIFYTKDEKAIILAPGTEHQFQQLCRCLNIPELIEEPKFQSKALRLANREQLNFHLNKAFLHFGLKEILERCDEKGVPVAPINNLEALFNLPAAQQLILEEKLNDGTMSKRVKTAIFK